MSNLIDKIDGQANNDLAKKIGVKTDSDKKQYLARVPDSKDGWIHAAKSDAVYGDSKPFWAREPWVRNQYGFSRTKLFQLAKAGKITSVSLREEGMTKATRLFNVESIDNYIESFLPNSNA